MKHTKEKKAKAKDTTREWRPPTRTDADLKHKSHATLYYDRNQYPSSPSGFIG